LKIGKYGHLRVMTESEYINKLKVSWPKNCDASIGTITLADEAICAFPKSAQLWCMRGSLIQLGPENCPHSLNDVLACYQKAIEIDPQFAEAWEEIGYFYDAVLDDEAGAEKYFTEAKKLKEKLLV
jgi:tetratricopeptide (TPR) repeat protein